MFAIRDMIFGRIIVLTEKFGLGNVRNLNCRNKRTLKN